MTVSSNTLRTAWSTFPFCNDKGLEACWPVESRVPVHTFYRPAQSFVSVRGDICKPGMFVWRTGPIQGVARVLEILSMDRSLTQGNAPAVIVRLTLFNLTGRHRSVECPCLVKGDQYLVQPQVCPHSVLVARRTAHTSVGGSLCCQCAARLLQTQLYSRIVNCTSSGAHKDVGEGPNSTAPGRHRLHTQYLCPSSLRRAHRAS